MNAPGHGEISYQMIKQLPLKTKDTIAQKKSSTISTRTRNQYNGKLQL